MYSLLKHSKQDSSGVAPLKSNGRTLVLVYECHFDVSPVYGGNFIIFRCMMSFCRVTTNNSDSLTIVRNQMPLTDNSSMCSAPNPRKRLSSLAQRKLQELNKQGCNLTFQSSPYSQIHEIHISVKGIEKLLKSLNPHKAVGPDQIKSIVLQTLHAELAPILQVLFQKSLDSGKLPHIWKEANVSPIFKEGYRSDSANYRPILLTCVLCKVLEHIVASNLTKHSAYFNILFELQQCFREKRSCKTRLVMLVDEIAKTCRWENKLI